MATFVTVVLRLDTREAGKIREHLLGKESATGQANYRHLARRFIHGLNNELEAALRGVRTANLWASITGSASPAAFPTAGIACVQAEAAGHYVEFTFGTVAVRLTEGVDFVRGANDAATATNLAAAINANTILKGVFSAEAASDDVTITGKIPGAFLQDVAISTDETDAFTITAFSGGVEGTAQFFPVQLLLNKAP